MQCRIRLNKKAKNDKRRNLGPVSHIRTYINIIQTAGARNSLLCATLLGYNDSFLKVT